MDPFYDLDLPEAQQRREKEQKLSMLVKVCCFVLVVVAFVTMRKGPQQTSRNETTLKPTSIVFASSDEKKKFEQKIVSLETELKILKSKAQRGTNERERALHDELDKQKELVSSLLTSIESRQKSVESKLASISAELESVSGATHLCGSSQCNASHESSLEDSLSDLRSDAAALGSELAALKAAPNDFSDLAAKLLHHSKVLQTRLSYVHNVMDTTAKEAQASCPACPAAPSAPSPGLPKCPPTAETCSRVLKEQALTLEASSASNLDSVRLEGRRECQREITQRVAEKEKAFVAEKEALEKMQQLSSLHVQCDVPKESVKPAPIRVDFAQISAGGSIDYRNTSKTFVPPHWRLGNASPSLSKLLPVAFLDSCVVQLTDLLGIDRDTGAPEDAIKGETKMLGSCWPMAGQEGHMTVRLQNEVMVDAVTIQHISR